MLRFPCSVFERYPTALAFVGLCAGIVTARAVGSSIQPWSYAALVFALALVPVALRNHAPTLVWTTVTLLMFSTGLALASKDLANGRDFFPSSSKRTVHSTVNSLVSSGPDFRVLLIGAGLDATSNSLLPGYGRLFVRENTIPLCAGDRIAFRSYIKKPTNKGNPGEYDWEMYCRTEKVLWLASIRGGESILVLSRGSPYDFRSLMFRLRESMSRFLEEHSEGSVRAVHKGVVVGDRGEIDPALNQRFINSGLVHILSASGLHVGIVAILGLVLARAVTLAVPSLLLFVPLKKMAAATAIPLMVTYCWVVGARVPSVRATIMGLVVAVAILLDRRWYSLNSLALAGLLILLINPLSLFTPEFQLSFAAVFGILFVVPTLMSRLDTHNSSVKRSVESDATTHGSAQSTTRWSRVVRHVVALLLTSVAATLAVMPFLIEHFHSFPLYTLLANLLAIPLCTATLPIAFSAAIVGIAFPTIAAWILVPASVFTWMMIEVARIVSDLPGSTVKVAHLGYLAAVPFGALMLLFLWFMRQLSRKEFSALAGVGLALVAFLAIGPWLRSYTTDFRVIFLNVGKADAALIQPPGSRGLLIDGGLRNPYFDSGASILVPFFDWAGIRALDAVVITHPQMDHMGGILTAIQRAPPRVLQLNDIGTRPAFLQEILAVAERQGTSVIQVDRTVAPARFGGAEIRFLNPPAKVASGKSYVHHEVNNASVVMRMEYGEISFLFAGDIERDAEEELLAAGLPLRASVLKVPHHGCKTSTSGAFLRAVQPKVAVISSDYRSGAACPSRRVLEDLKAGGTEIVWTGRDGAVTIETDGRDLRIKTGKPRTGELVSRE